ncbi:MAG: hypothetical protein ABH952_06070 [Candidatus Omnitrophota bacterium]
MKRFTMITKFDPERLQNAQALIIVIIVFAIVLSLGAALILHVRSFRDVSSLQVDTDMANSLVKTGTSMAETFLDDNPFNRNVDEEYTLTDGKVKIKINTSVVPGAESYIVQGDYIVTGISGRSQRSFKKIVNLPVDGWTQVYTGTAWPGASFIRPLQQTPDGGCIIGIGEWSGDTKKFFVIKTDVLGNIEWAKSYDISGTERLYSLQQTFDGGYILMGENSDNGLLLIKTNVNGNLGATLSGTWARKYIGVSYPFFNGYDQPIKQTSEGGYIFAGRITDAVIIKTDADGNVGDNYLGTWANTYDITIGGGVEQILCIDELSDGSYVFAGTTDSITSTSKFLLIKTDTNGVVNWAKVYGGWEGVDRCRSVRRTPEGGYILGGITSSFGTTGTLLIKTDDDGDIEWARKYDTGGNGDGFTMVQPVAGGGYIWGDGEMGTIKTDALGVPVWQRSSCDWPYQTLQGGYILCDFSGIKVLKVGIQGPTPFLTNFDVTGSVQTWNHPADFTINASPPVVSITTQVFPVDFKVITQDITATITTTRLYPPE